MSNVKENDLLDFLHLDVARNSIGLFFLPIIRAPITIWYCCGLNATHSQNVYFSIFIFGAAFCSFQGGVFFSVGTDMLTSKQILTLLSFITLSNQMTEGLFKSLVPFSVFFLIPTLSLSEQAQYIL